MSVEVPYNILGRRYVLHDVLGRGGMGIVYRAVDRLTGQQVALKRVINEPITADAASSNRILDFRMALAQEFKLSASLRHPNVIEVLDYGFDDENHPYFTMELLENPLTIYDYGSDQPFETQINLIVQVLYALAYLHRRGILHRDLKPANILVSNGRVKVLDFGLSIMHEHMQNQEFTGEGTTAGTLAYMSPEVLLGENATQASDLYAVGMIGYELLTGAHPFNIDEPSTLVNEILYSFPDFNGPHIGNGLKDVFSRLLNKDPESRYTDATTALQALTSAVESAVPVETIATRESFLKAARLIGRDAEVEQLSAGLSLAVQRQGNAWLVAGESGVGKSRLIDELRTLALVRGADVMRGFTVSVGGQPYDMWRPILRWLCLLDDSLADSEIAFIKNFVPDVEGLIECPIIAAEVVQPETIHNRMISLIHTILSRQETPAVMIFEDIHWAGSESLRALTQLIGMVHDLPLMIVATYRDDEAPDLFTRFPGTPVLKLGRLDEESIARLSEAMLGEAGARSQVVYLLQKETEGNVFFLIEVVRALAEEAGKLEEIGRTTLPERVFAEGMKTVIHRRLHRLPDDAIDVLRFAAVMGRDLDINLLNKLAPQHDLSNWLTVCLNAAVLEVDDGQWRFAHDKLREGVLDELDTTRLRGTHHRVAEVLEAEHSHDVAYVAALAHHWRMASVPEREAQYVTLAGENSLKNGAYHEAIDFFRRAQALLRDATATYDERLVLKREVHLKQQTGRANLGLGDYSTARINFHEALALARTLVDDQLQASSLSDLGDVAYVLAEFEQARHFYQRANTHYQAANDRSGIAKSLNSLGNALFELGEQDEATSLYQKSLNMSREIGDQWGMAGALTTQLVSAVDLSEYKLTRSQLMRKLEDLSQSEDKVQVADTYFELGRIAQDSKDYAEARTQYNKSLDLSKQLQDSDRTITIFRAIGALESETRDYDAAWKAYQSALQQVADARLLTSQLEILLEVARLSIAREDYRIALQLLAFLIYNPDSPEQIQDDAEHLGLELEAKMVDADMASAWEAGKSAEMESILNLILA